MKCEMRGKWKAVAKAAVSGVWMMLCKNYLDRLDEESDWGINNMQGGTM